MIQSAKNFRFECNPILSSICFIFLSCVLLTTQVALRLIDSNIMALVDNLGSFVWIPQEDVNVKVDK